MAHEEINILAMLKGEERYIFIFNDNNRIEMLRTLGRYAADPQLSFSWYDAAVMSKKVRELAFAQESDHAPCHTPFANQSQPAPHRRFEIRQEEDMI
ncbi:MAG: hypothetical protein KF752_14105 [Pirellulaceae bacterium]|nr:hypothetical protein [Pirellulaceae bacterium]